MARMAVVDQSTGEVLNVIVASPSDPCPYANATLVEMTDQGGIGWTWTEADGFVPPPQPPEEPPPE